MDRATDMVAHVSGLAVLAVPWLTAPAETVEIEGAVAMAQSTRAGAPLACAPPLTQLGAVAAEDAGHPGSVGHWEAAAPAEMAGLMEVSGLMEAVVVMGSVAQATAAVHRNKRCEPGRQHQIPPQQTRSVAASLLVPRLATESRSAPHRGRRSVPATFVSDHLRP